jgi:hypothetical protein
MKEAYCVYLMSDCKVLMVVAIEYGAVTPRRPLLMQTGQPFDADRSALAALSLPLQPFYARLLPSSQAF